MKMIKITIGVKDDEVDKAVKTLKGYCSKHSDCATCRFYDKENCDCVLAKGEIPPCDWSVNDDRQRKAD